MVFPTEAALYRPILSKDDGTYGNRYLVIKVAQTPQREPKFAEVKDEVKAAWKKAEAAKLALEKAEKLAKEVEEAGLSLSEFFNDNPDVDVVLTAPFAKLTIMPGFPEFGIPPTIEMSQPAGIETPKSAHDRRDLQA